MSVTEPEFETLADETLAALREALDGVGFDADVELMMGILSIEFPDGTKYVINSHRAAKQIWMAAELTAWHFDVDPATSVWTATKSDEELWATLSRVLSKKLGRDVRLSRS